MTRRSTPADRPRPALTAWLARCAKVARFAWAQVAEQQLLQVAASLTFTAVLAMVPMLAVVLSLFTAFPLFQEFRIALEQFLTQSLMPPTVSENIMEYLNQFALQASRLTAIGGAFLIVTSIFMIMTIDQTLNDIWHVTRQRPLPQRALVYWAVLTLGPVVTGASLWATSYVARESMGLVGDVPGILGVLVSFLPLLVTGAGFTALFVVVPNRRVFWRDAMIGGFGAAIVLEIMKAGFAYYLTQFPTYTVIYGAFATLPIFLLWVYLSWLAILVGAVTAASLPLIRLGRWEPDREPGAPFLDAIGVLRLLRQALGQRPTDRSATFLAAHLRLQFAELYRVLETLEQMGMIARTSDNRWLLSCDPATTSLTPLFDNLLLNRAQARLQNDPDALRVLRSILMGDEPPMLEELRQTAQNSDKLGLDPADRTPVVATTAQGDNHHAKSQ
ncbi:MAG: YihY family inner membrane protein [Burkholderiaceae bacterium]|nr:YihY family inner membrane protein [Burkholderiaceae bacterium]